MRLNVYVCDVCRKKRSANNVSWEKKPCKTKFVCPKDGVNGGRWDFHDTCPECREALADAISETVKKQRESK